MVETVRVIVQGRVQGVAFRYYTRAKAVELGVAGTVRNLDDGTVEVIAQGPAGVLEPFLAWLDQGPPAAKVIGKSVEHIESSTTFSTFEITH